MKLFEPGRIGKMRLKNRIVMAPMGVRFVEPDGRISQQGIDYFVARARGGTGLIITGGFLVTRGNGGEKISPAFPIVDDVMYIARLNKLAEAVHDYGAKLSIQLHNSLRYIASPGIRYSEIREMTIGEIERLVQAYEFAAGVVSDAGVDCIDIHSHKGGFLDQFLTSLWNKRTDKYGGSLENRLRFPLEVIQAVKRGAGADFPVTYRYGLTHYLAGGREIEEGLEIARRLEAAGADALNIDAGCEETIYWIHPPTTQPPGCMVDLAAMVKKVVEIPVITVGKLGYPELAERVLQEGKADFIGLGRALLADPEWPNKVREGRFEDICPCICDHEGCEVREDKRKYRSCTVN
ncbi:NADH:flavin oxidoreductase, partial [Chloroflexota bacterium]